MHAPRQELETAAQQQCCRNRIFDQCHERNDCRDTESETGYITGLHALPMCCSFCEDFYDSICTYEVRQCPRERSTTLPVAS